MVVCATSPCGGALFYSVVRSSRRYQRSAMHLLIAASTKKGAPESQENSQEGASQSAGKRLPERNRWWKRLSSREDAKRENVVMAGSGEMDIKWGDIVNPTPENLLALLLSGLLGLAILQIFWQLLLVAITVTLAALKYSVIAAILLTLLIVFL